MEIVKVTEANQDLGWAEYEIRDEVLRGIPIAGDVVCRHRSCLQVQWLYVKYCTEIVCVVLYYTILYYTSIT